MLLLVITWNEHRGLSAARLLSKVYLATELGGKGKQRLMLSMGKKRFYGIACVTRGLSMRPGPFEEAQEQFSSVAAQFGW